MEPIKYLSKKILKKYYGRKQEALISLIIDVAKEKIYPVSKHLEHIDVAELLLGKTKKELAANPKLAAHLIPSTIEIINGQVTGVITGISGLELGFGVRHNRKDLHKAHEIIWSCIILSQQIGTIKVGKLKANRIIF